MISVYHVKERCPRNICKRKSHAHFIVDIPKMFNYESINVYMDNILINTPAKKSTDREVEEMRARVRRRLVRYA